MLTDQKALLEKYGITVEQKTIYRYKEHRYDHLKDAVNYARIEAKRKEPVVK